MNNNRKVLGLIGAGLVAALPGMAAADEPSNVMLGEAAAVLDFCAKTDTRLEDVAETYRKQLTREASPGARSSDEYRQGYDLITSAMAKFPKATVLAACWSVVPRSKERSVDGDEHHEHGGPEHQGR
jgi:hypothetical protein